MQKKSSSFLELEQNEQGEGTVQGNIHEDGNGRVGSNDQNDGIGGGGSSNGDGGNDSTTSADPNGDIFNLSGGYAH